MGVCVCVARARGRDIQSPWRSQTLHTPTWAVKQARASPQEVKKPRAFGQVSEVLRAWRRFQPSRWPQAGFTQLSAPAAPALARTTQAPGAQTGISGMLRLRPRCSPGPRTALLPCVS